MFYFLFFLAFAVILVLGAILAVVIVNYQRSLEKQMLIDEKLKLLKRVNKKVNKLLAETQLAVEAIKADFSKNLAEVSKVETAAFITASQELRTKSLKHLEDFAVFLSGQIKGEFEELGTAAEKGILLSEQELRDRIMKKYAEIELDLEKYKHEAAARLDAEILAAVKQVTLQTLGEVIEPEKHKELVIAALDHAKRKLVL